MPPLSEKVIALTGGTGVLGRALARGLAEAGADLVLLARDEAKAEALLATLPPRSGAQPPARHRVLRADVLDRASLVAAAAAIESSFGRLDVLLNGAGGNDPRATAAPQSSFFELPAEALRHVMDLNLMGTILPCQVLGRLVAGTAGGAILNVSSVNASRPLTRIVAYSAAKAAVTNFTQWLAVHLAQTVSPSLRVNALMPGFFLTEQNRFLLTDRETGALTERGKAILAHTPAGRFGSPEDLVGAAVFLLSDAARFITGVVLPVDGGFTAFSGV